MKEQYNFKLEENLKKELEDLHAKSEICKEDFLKNMMNAYKNETLNKINDDIDLSKYDNIDSSTKLVINDTFKHILEVIQVNTTNSKIKASQLDLEKEIFKNKKDTVDKNIQSIKNECENEKLNLTNNFNDQLKIKNDKISILEKKLEDMEQMKLISDQAKSILEDNKRLKLEIESL